MFAFFYGCWLSIGQPCSRSKPKKGSSCMLDSRGCSWGNSTAATRPVHAFWGECTPTQSVTHTHTHCFALISSCRPPVRSVVSPFGPKCISNPSFFRSFSTQCARRHQTSLLLLLAPSPFNRLILATLTSPRFIPPFWLGHRHANAQTRRYKRFS